MNQVEKMELLAPAGTSDVLKGVIEAGCDSVYLGGKLFGMRQHGDWLNFDRDDMVHAVEYAHAKNVKIYITVNNLLTDSELKELKDYLLFLNDLSPDALLIQDLGALRLVNHLGITIPLHASTMMNVHNAFAARHLKEMGIKRIVCSKDISICEAARIKEEADIEVEYFLHNDVCVSEGSICYFSGIVTENSANRGQCIKPCRWRWDFVNAETGEGLGKLSTQYFLAQKDICLFHQIPELITNNIGAGKIEGRARVAEYLVPIVRAYRQAIDCYYEDPYSYTTDFDTFREMHKGRIRDYTSNHAFKDPGYSGCDQSGRREPRFFSIVAEEKGIDENLKNIFRQQAVVRKREAVPQLAVRCCSCKSARAAIDNGADLVYVGGEFHSKTGETPWKLSQLTHLAETVHEQGKEIALVSPRILGNREMFEFGRMLELMDDLGIRTVLAANLGAYQFVKERAPSRNFRIISDFTFNVFNSQTLRYLKGIGIHRATVSPELTFSQVSALTQKKVLPMECLVHGSLFGMILESCLISALLGKTTKMDPCIGFCVDKKYALRDRLNKDRMVIPDQYCRNHLLMEKDLCLLNVIDHLKGLGINTVRIEGQYYSDHTVAEIVALYRKYIDLTMTLQPREELVVDEQDWRHLLEVSPRELSYGAYVNQTVNVAKACESLPTDEIILYKERFEKVRMSPQTDRLPW